MIPLDFPATLTWPGTSRWLAAKAETIWIGALLSLSRADGFAIDGDHPSRYTAHRGHPGDEAPLKRFAIKAAKISPMRSCIGVRSRNGQKRRRQPVIEQVHHLPRLTRVGRVIEMTKKDVCPEDRATVCCWVIHRRLPPNESEDRYGLSILAVCHAFLLPIGEAAAGFCVDPPPLSTPSDGSAPPSGPGSVGRHLPSPRAG